MRCSKRKCDASREGDDGCSQEVSGTAQVFKFNAGTRMQLVQSLQSPVQRSSAGTTYGGKQHDVWVGLPAYKWSRMRGAVRQAGNPTSQFHTCFASSVYESTTWAKETYQTSMRHWAKIASLVCLQTLWSWVPLLAILAVEAALVEPVLPKTLRHAHQNNEHEQCISSGTAPSDICG